MNAEYIRNNQGRGKGISKERIFLDYLGYNRSLLKFYTNALFLMHVSLLMQSSPLVCGEDLLCFLKGQKKGKRAILSYILTQTWP